MKKSQAEDEFHSRWCGYNPTVAPNFVPGRNPRLYFGRMHEIPYGQTRQSRKRRSGTASIWKWPDSAEEMIGAISGKWFAEGLPDQGTPFLIWTWETEDGKGGAFAVPTYKWVNGKWKASLSKRRIRRGVVKDGAE